MPTLSIAASYRDDVLDLLLFLSDANKQREFASSVYYADYVSEFMSWWFDDSAKDNYEFSTDLIRLSFTEPELRHIFKFSQVFSSLWNCAAAELTINELLQRSDWQKTMASAKIAFDNISKLESE